MMVVARINVLTGWYAGMQWKGVEDNVPEQISCCPLQRQAVPPTVYVCDSSAGCETSVLTVQTGR